MSDLDSFFAKRDKKKKKGAFRSPANTATASSTAPPTVTTDRKNNASQIAEPQAAPQKQTDDGWIEIEDPKTAQVNTGGRTVGQFKRDAEDKEQVGAQDAPTEKFSGWTLKEEEPPKPVEQAEETPKIRTAWKPAGPDISSGAQFPSLKDAADAPQVPVSFKTGGSTSSGSGMPGRPRFVNSRAGPGATGGSSLSSAGRPRFINSNPNKFAGLERDN